MLNLEQRHAVASVLCGAGGGTPFALFGPPGTGKTVTLVECALQVSRAVLLDLEGYMYSPSYLFLPQESCCCGARLWRRLNFLGASLLALEAVKNHSSLLQ